MALSHQRKPIKSHGGASAVFSGVTLSKVARCEFKACKKTQMASPSSLCLAAPLALSLSAGAFSFDDAWMHVQNDFEEGLAPRVLGTGLSRVVLETKGHLGEIPKSDCVGRAPPRCASARQASQGHGPGRPFTCRMCSYQSSYANDMRRHERTHTGEKPFACSMCSYRASQASDLRGHERTHTGERPFACSI